MSGRPSARDQFGPVAETYLTSAVHASSDALAELVALVNPNGGKVLDVGTGAGHAAYAFAPHVDAVVAFDMTPEMLAVVERESAAKGLANISIQQGDALDLPFGGRAFEGVMCRLAAHHFSDAGQFVREVFRVLKPGGWFLLADTVSPEDQDAADAVNRIEDVRDPSHVWNLKVSEWTGAMKDAGFAVGEAVLRRKFLVFTEWTERMRVSAEDTAWLEGAIFGSTGAVREYLNPVEEPVKGFDLIEAAILATKPE